MQKPLSVKPAQFSDPLNFQQNIFPTFSKYWIRSGWIITNCCVNVVSASFQQFPVKTAIISFCAAHPPGKSRIHRNFANHSIVNTPGPAIQKKERQKVFSEHIPSTKSLTNSEARILIVIIILIIFMFNEHCPLFILPHDLLHYNACLGPLRIKKIERDFLNVISKNCATTIIGIIIIRKSDII